MALSKSHLPCLVLVEPRKHCDEAGDYVVPNVLSPRDLVFRPDNMDETVSHTLAYWGRSGAVDRASDFGPRGPWFDSPPVHISLWPEQVTFTLCLVLVKPRKRWTDDRLGQIVTRLEITLCLMC